MVRKIKIGHIKRLFRAKVRNALDDELMDILVKFGLIESAYDLKLYEEDVDIIELYYDRSTKWIVLHNASILAFLALLIGTWNISVWLNVFFWFMFFFALVGAVSSNIRVNLLFNTLLKKKRNKHIK